MIYIEDVLVDIDNNYHLFKNSVDYTWAKFMQVSKMLKGSMIMFFSTFDLALI